MRYKLLGKLYLWKVLFVERLVCCWDLLNTEKIPSSFLDCEAEESPGEMTDSFLALSELGHLGGSK